MVTEVMSHVRIAFSQLLAAKALRMHLIGYKVKFHFFLLAKVSSKTSASFDAFFPFFSLTESQPGDLKITAYK